MFDSGFLELLVVGIIALLVVGPERLPEVAAKTGKFIGKMKAFVANTREDIEKEIRSEEMQSMLNQQKSEISELRDMMSKTSKNAGANLKEATDMLNSSMKDAKSSIDNK